MRSGLWFLAGAGAGAYAVVKARRAAEALTPDGLRDRAQGLALGARLLRDEVAQRSLEKETELRQRLGLTSHGILDSSTGGKHRAEVTAARAAAGPAAEQSMTSRTNSQKGND